VTRGVARNLELSGGKTSRLGPSPFFTHAGEKLLFQFLRVRAPIGRGQTRDAFFTSRKEHFLTLSAARQETAKLYFGAKTKPDKTSFELFMRRCPGLKRYRVGMLEQSQDENSQLEVVAK